MESSSLSLGSVSLQVSLQEAQSEHLLSLSDEAGATDAAESERGTGSEPWGWTLVTFSKSSTRVGGSCGDDRGPGSSE